METDREILEAAARAEGHGVEFDDLSGLTFLDTKFSGLLWDPLHNDGDALRLAVKMNLLVMPYPLDKAVRVVDSKTADNTIVSWGTPADPYDATRRAITQAAARMSPNVGVKAAAEGSPP